MSLNFILHITDFHNLKIVNNIFFLIFEGGLIFLSRGVYIIFRITFTHAKELIYFNRIL